MAALPDDVKRFIVLALACHDSPTRVSESVRAEFGLSVPRQQIETYDPERRAGRAISKKWRDLFQSTRDAWRRQVQEVPIANKLARLRALDRLAERAESLKNYPLVLQALEQAAKEVGGFYEGRLLGAAGHRAGERPSPTPVTAGQQMVLAPDEPVPSKPVL